MARTLSIITNFGCHYGCPYCVVKKNGIQVPKTTVAGLDNLKSCIDAYQCDTVSVSGGGDPLYEYEEHIAWWLRLFIVLREANTPLEIHTSYINSGFPMRMCKKVSYHLRDKNLISRIRRRGCKCVRVVFVVTDDMTERDLHEISRLVKESSDVDQLSFRQMIRENYTVSYHLHDVLKAGHGVDWWYIEQGDYNLYYAEGRIYEKYSDFSQGTAVNQEARNGY